MATASTRVSVEERPTADTVRPAWSKRRLHHVFGEDGRAVVCAMDHSRTGGTAGLLRPAESVARVVAGGADAILATIGTARAAAAALGGRGLILALDSEGPIADYGVEQALRFGADAVELKVFPGSPGDSKLADLRRLAARCAEWGMPLLAEMIPVSFADVGSHTVDNIRAVSRVGAEAGGDFVKVHYVGPVEAYRSVVEACPVPLLVLGGPRAADARAALQMAADALEAGACGVVYGRNIITHERPDRMTSALCEIVHGGATVEAAARSLTAPH